VAASDQSRVTLTDVDRSMTGEYQCEVSADAPLFHTDIKAAEMVVVEPPLINPNVTSDRVSYIGGDHIRVPGFTGNHVLNYSNGYASSLATLELEAAALSPVPTLLIRCEASIFEIWKATSHTLILRERSANPASALGRSLTGAARETCLPTIIVLLLQVFLQFILQNYTVVR
ncbi:putative beat protein, partial [Operophtera brumata]